MNSSIHQEFPQPDDPTVLAWRYLDLPKLLSLLLKKELYLTRLDLKWSLRDGPLRWVLIDVLHSARILVGRQVSE